jgi:hypothetical protein
MHENLVYWLREKGLDYYNYCYRILFPFNFFWCYTKLPVLNENGFVKVSLRIGIQALLSS